MIVDERCSDRGVANALLTRLLETLAEVPLIHLGCAPEAAPFFEQRYDFQPTGMILLRRTAQAPHD